MPKILKIKSTIVLAAKAFAVREDVMAVRCLLSHVFIPKSLLVVRDRYAVALDVDTSVGKLAARERLCTNVLKFIPERLL